MNTYKISTFLFTKTDLSRRTDLTINYLLIALAFFSTFSRAIGTALIGLIFILFLISGDYSGKLKRIKQDYISVSFISLFALLCIGLLWTENLELGEYVIRKSKYLLLLPILIAVYDTRFTPTIIKAFLLSMVVSEISSYLLFFEIVEPGTWGTDHTQGAGHRDPTPFMGHGEYSFLLAITASVILYQLISSIRNNSLAAFFFGVFFTTVSINLFLTGGRTGQLAYLFTTGIVVYHFIPNKKRFLVGLILFASLTYTLAYNLSDTFNKRVNHTIHEIEQISNFNLTTSWGSRLRAIIVGVDVYLDNPLYGVGTGDYLDEAKRSNGDLFPNLPPLLLEKHLHNQIVQPFVQIGILALIPLAFFIIGFLKKMTLNTPLLSSLFFASIILSFSGMWLMDYFLTLVFSILYVAFSRLDYSQLKGS